MTKFPSDWEEILREGVPLPVFTVKNYKPVFDLKGSTRLIISKKLHIKPQFTCQFTKVGEKVKLSLQRKAWECLQTLARKLNDQKGNDFSEKWDRLCAHTKAHPDYKIRSNVEGTSSDTLSQFDEDYEEIDVHTEDHGAQYEELEHSDSTDSADVSPVRAQSKKDCRVISKIIPNKDEPALTERRVEEDGSTMWSFDHLKGWTKVPVEIVSAVDFAANPTGYVWILDRGNSNRTAAVVWIDLFSMKVYRTESQVYSLATSVCVLKSGTVLISFSDGSLAAYRNPGPEPQMLITKHESLIGVVSITEGDGGIVYAACHTHVCVIKTPLMKVVGIIQPETVAPNFVDVKYDHSNNCCRVLDTANGFIWTVSGDDALEVSFDLESSLKGSLGMCFSSWCGLLVANPTTGKIAQLDTFLGESGTVFPGWQISNCLPLKICETAGTSLCLGSSDLDVHVPNLLHVIPEGHKRRRPKLGKRPVSSIITKTVAPKIPKTSDKDILVELVFNVGGRVVKQNLKF